MMGRWAVIREADNVVDNIIEWDGETPWDPPPAHFVAPIGEQECDRGYYYHPTDGTFGPDPEPEP